MEIFYTELPESIIRNRGSSRPMELAGMHPVPCNKQRRSTMKGRSAILILALAFVLAFCSPGFAEVEWEIQQTLKLDSAPLDVAVSVDGKWLFVLTDKGAIVIFSSNGTEQDKIDVGDHVDKIDAGPSEDILFLKSRKHKTVEIVTLDFIRDINVFGSPSKGPVDAPVVIAVFTDFQ